MKKQIFKTPIFRVIVLAYFVFSSLFLVVPQHTATAASPGIVYTQGTQFVLDGYPFYYAGCNSYDLFTKSNAEIDTRMANMAADGVKVVRTWGFSHETWHGFEAQKGVYSEEQFRLFDYIMKSARDHGIKVIITLENYWEAYGGIDTRLAWEGLSGTSHANRAKFFTTPGCKTSYKNYVNHFVTRVNTLTGVAYADDQTIFAWELMNEPRYQDAGENSTGTTLRAWVDEMAGYIKTLDPKHMVGAGIEGHQAKYGFGGDEGNPFVYLQQSPYIDFCTAHPYPDETWANLSVAQAAGLVDAWIADAHDVVGKPFVLEEFNTHSNKDAYWNAMYAEIESKNAAGDNFWNYNDITTSDFDILHGNAILTNVFKPHATKMAAKNGSPVHAPLAINQSSPVNGATGLMPRIVLKWEPSVGAKTYNLVVSENSSYASPIINVTGLTGTQYTPTVDLAFGTKYYWKVTGVNSLGNTDATNAGISFTIRTAPTVAPGSFTQTAPVNNLVGAGLRPVFTWTASTEALSYNLVVSPNADYSSPAINATYLTDTTYTPAADLTMNVKYYWKVTAVNNIGQTAAANSGISFTTIDLPPVNTTAKVQAMLNGNTSSETQYKIMAVNTGADKLDNFSARVFVNLTEVYAAGLTVTNVLGEKLYDQAGNATVTGPFAWDTANQIYYFQVNWPSYTLNAGQSIEYDLRVRLNNWQSNWDGTNDYSYKGLGTSFVDTQYIPLYHGNLKMWGVDPGQTATPTPTRTVTTTPTVTPTPTRVVTITPTPTSRITPTPTTGPSPTAIVTPTPTRRNTPTATPLPTATPTPTRRVTVTATPTGIVTPTPTRTVTATPTPTGTGGYVVSYVIQSDWGTGATINVTITNQTTSAVNGWTLAFTFPGNQTITNLWNGTYTQSGAAVSVKDGGFNANIPVNGGSVNFGFNLNYSGTNLKPTSFTLNGTACQIQ